MRISPYLVIVVGNFITALLCSLHYGYKIQLRYARLFCGKNNKKLDCFWPDPNAGKISSCHKKPRKSWVPAASELTSDTGQMLWLTTTFQLPNNTAVHAFSIENEHERREWRGSMQRSIALQMAVRSSVPDSCQTNWPIIFDKNLALSIELPLPMLFIEIQHDCSLGRLCFAKGNGGKERNPILEHFHRKMAGYEAEKITLWSNSVGYW